MNKNNHIKQTDITINQPGSQVKSENHSRTAVKANLSEAGRFRQKTQISTIPGTHQRERHRYRVTLEGEILGDRLTTDEALALVKGGAK